MPPFSSQSALPLPRGWSKVTRAGVLHAISVAAMAMTSAWSRVQPTTIPHRIRGGFRGWFSDSRVEAVS